MSYNNFKPTFWSKHIQVELERLCTLADWCNTKFEGEAKKGEQVKILGLAVPTIGDYTGADIGAPEKPADESQYLKITEAKFFNVGIDDVDKAQSINGIMETNLTNAAREFATIRDKFVGALAKGADGIADAGSVTTAKAAKQAIDAAILKLRENDVPTNMEVVIELPWFMYNIFKDNLAELKTNNDNLLEKGIISMYDGCYVRPSNNLLEEDGTYYCMVRTHDAIAFASGIDKVEAYRPQGTFEDAVKGLNTFGAKIVRPKELSVFTVKKA
jgi:hypothetical protein